MTVVAPAARRVQPNRNAKISVTARAWDEQRIELSALRQAALEHCDFIEPRLEALYPVAIELGVVAEQLTAGALHSVARLRRRATGVAL